MQKDYYTLPIFSAERKLVNRNNNARDRSDMHIPKKAKFDDCSTSGVNNKSRMRQSALKVFSSFYF